MKIRKFEDLEIWKASIKIIQKIYLLSSNSNFKRDFDLVRQIRRAAVSVSSNIAEGFERNNNNELIRMLKIAKGSAGEVKNQLYIALLINYINKEEFNYVAKELEILINQVGKFISYLHKKRKENFKLVKPAKPAKLVKHSK